ncbi:MAG: homoserine kinase [Alphaproteobacteria bacterium]|nr:homoserine kinase [Alphaproteobacteria bacterium]
MAVYTEVSEAEAKAFLADYDLGELRELVGIKQGVENTNYFLYTSVGRYVLTLYEKRVKEDDLPYFLGLMEHLAKAGVPCPPPLRNREHEPVGRIAGRAAAITCFLDGKPLSRVTPNECGEVGRALAGLHLAGMDFTQRRANTLSLDGWENLLDLCKPRADEVQPGLGALLTAELEYLNANWPRDLLQGAIHADLFPDNVFFEGNKLSGLIDFYFACDDLFAYDLAICLNAWCFENNVAFNITKARALFGGYNQVRPLSDGETKALAVLARGAALRFLLTRLHDWLHQVPEAFVKPKDPLDYLTRLQFHQLVSDTAAYGIGA